MPTIKTYCKGAPFYNAFLRTWLSGSRSFASTDEMDQEENDRKDK